MVRLYGDWGTYSHIPSQAKGPHYEWQMNVHLNPPRLLILTLQVLRNTVFVLVLSACNKFAYIFLKKHGLHNALYWLAPSITNI